MQFYAYNSYAVLRHDFISVIHKIQIFALLSISIKLHIHVYSMLSHIPVTCGRNFFTL